MKLGFGYSRQRLSHSLCSFRVELSHQSLNSPGNSKTRRSEASVGLALSNPPGIQHPPSANGLYDPQLSHWVLASLLSATSSSCLMRFFCTRPLCKARSSPLSSHWVCLGVINLWEVCALMELLGLLLTFKWILIEMIAWPWEAALSICGWLIALA